MQLMVILCPFAQISCGQRQATSPAHRYAGRVPQSGVYLSRMAPSLTTRGCKHARVVCPAVSSALFLTEPFHMGNLSAQHLEEVSVSHLLLAEEVLRVTCLPQDSHNLPDDGLLAAPLATMEIPDLFQSD